MKKIFELVKKTVINPLFLIFLGIFLYKLFLIIDLKGSCFEPDAYQHFLDLKSVYKDFPANLSIGLSQWHKPVYTYTFGLIVNFFQLQSLTFVQILNLILSIISSGFVYLCVLKLFSGKKKLGYLAVILYSFGWITFQSSLTAMTEPIYTVLVISAFYLVLKKKFNIASLLFGLSVLARFEGMLFVGLYFLWLVLTNIKNLKFLFIQVIWIGLPIFIWNFLGYLSSGNMLFLLNGGYTSQSVGIYGYGEIQSLFKKIFLEEPIVLSSFILGLLLFLKRLINRDKPRVEEQGFVLVFIFVVTSIIFQSVLWVGGLFGSAGLTRYFVGTMPFMVIGSIYGINEVFLKISNKILLKFAWISLVVIQIGFALNLYWGFSGKPLKPVFPSEFAQAGEWIKKNVPLETKLFYDRPEVVYFANRDYTNSFLFTHDMLNTEKGIFTWSKEWGKVVTGYTLEELEKNTGEKYKSDNQIYLFEVK